MGHKKFDKIKTKALPDSEVEITGEISLQFLVESRKEALAEINQKISIPGFRSGNIPEDVLIKKVGEMVILEETAEIAFGKSYPEIIKEEKISAIGRPNISITKLAPGIPLEFKIITAVEPDFKLPDYKKISKEVSLKEEKIEVLDKDIDDVLEEIKKQNWKPELKEGEDLREKVKENILKEKEFRAKEKKRINIMNALIKESEINVPKVLVQAELEKMVGTFKDDVARTGSNWKDYLTKIKKSEEDIKKEWYPSAVDRAKAELIVGKIAESEKIEPSPEELEHEAKHVLSHYPDAEPLRVRVYVYQVIRNQKVFEFLETL